MLIARLKAHLASGDAVDLLPVRHESLSGGQPVFQIRPLGGTQAYAIADPIARLVQRMP